MGPLFSNIFETLHGRSLVRVMQLQKYFTDRNSTFTDRFNRFTFASWTLLS